MTAPETLAVEVTADDIHYGLRQDNCECAVARAMRRLPGVDSAWAEFEEVTVTFTDDERNYSLPPEATAFIKAFDNGETVEPFTFTALREDKEES